jgi:outer membrane lipoprotein-sorting protein
MRKACHLLLALMPILVAVAHGADTDLDRLMALLAQKTHGHVSFEEQDYFSVLDRPVQSSGELLYARPDRLEKRTLAPKPASLILEKDSLTIQSGRHTRVLALDDYPQITPFIESMRATLAGDEVALRRIFIVELAGGLANWTLTLVPIDAKLRNAVQRIRIEGAQAELHSVTIVQADGDRSVMTIGPLVPP